mgnify:CR=1 FL=1
MRKMRVDGPYDLVIVVAHALYLLVKLIQTGHISAQGRVDTHHAKLFGEDSFDDKPAAVMLQSGFAEQLVEADVLHLVKPERVLITRSFRLPDISVCQFSVGIHDIG